MSDGLQCSDARRFCQRLPVAVAESGSALGLRGCERRRLGAVRWVTRRPEDGWAMGRVMWMETWTRTWTWRGSRGWDGDALGKREGAFGRVSDSGKPTGQDTPGQSLLRVISSRVARSGQASL